MGTYPLEKRKHVRIRAELPVSLEKATGITRDISATGAFFWTSGNHAIGDRIGFAIELKNGSGMVWSCEGEVVRVQLRGKNVGVAVKITETTVESANGRVSQANGGT